MLAAQLLLATAAWHSMFFWLRPTYMAANMIRRFVMISSVFTGALVVAWFGIVPAFGYVGVVAAILGMTVVQDSYYTLLLSWRSAWPLKNRRRLGDANQKT